MNEAIKALREIFSVATMSLFSQESEEEGEGDGDSSDDVSQELRRVLELDQSEGGEEGESEGVGTDTPDRPSNPAVPAPVPSGVWACVFVYICASIALTTSK